MLLLWILTVSMKLLINIYIILSIIPLFLGLSFIFGL